MRGQSVTNNFLLKIHLYIGLTLTESKMVANLWPIILKSKMVANLWPIILKSIKAMSYTFVILEQEIKMIGHRLAIIIFYSRFACI